MCNEREQPAKMFARVLLVQSFQLGAQWNAEPSGSLHRVEQQRSLGHCGLLVLIHTDFIYANLFLCLM